MQAWIEQIQQRAKTCRALLVHGEIADWRKGRTGYEVTADLLLQEIAPSFHGRIVRWNPTQGIQCADPGVRAQLDAATSIKPRNARGDSMDTENPQMAPRRTFVDLATFLGQVETLFHAKDSWCIALDYAELYFGSPNTLSQNERDLISRIFTVLQGEKLPRTELEATNPGHLRNRPITPPCDSHDATPTIVASKFNGDERWKIVMASQEGSRFGTPTSLNSRQVA
jgi:hypothetical protein